MSVRYAKSAAGPRRRCPRTPPASAARGLERRFGGRPATSAHGQHESDQETLTGAANASCVSAHPCPPLALARLFQMSMTVRSSTPDVEVASLLRMKLL
ncbi:hypothetical protein G6F68_017573 [Rhizopus microsporus]|nr:hypothetical protein G6F68_017573 [Rhizopus microsporus]